MILGSLSKLFANDNSQATSALSEGLESLMPGGVSHTQGSKVDQKIVLLSWDLEWLTEHTRDRLIRNIVNNGNKEAREPQSELTQVVTEVTVLKI